MRKFLSVLLIVPILAILLVFSPATAKPLDKASPILAGQFNNSLLFKDNYLQKNQVILWAHSNNIKDKGPKTVVWAIPSDASEELPNKKELPEPLRKEIDAVGVVIMDELSISGEVKTVIYSAPWETKKRIGIFSASKDLRKDEIRESIVAALSNETDDDEKLTSKQIKVAA